MHKAAPYIALAIPVVSLIIALSIAFGYSSKYKEAQNEYQDIEQNVGSAIENNINVLSAKKNEVDQQDKAELEQIDFYNLIQENSDIVAWITIPSCDINYPVVQGSDNSYYLDHTVKHTANFAGAIFMDSANEHDFNDMHTLIYGHNMKNNSMFGGLKKIRKNTSLINDSPYVYIFTPDGRVRQYQIFAMRQVEADSSAYRLFTGNQYYQEYLDECLSTSVPGINPVQTISGAPILSLSTCSGDDERLLVHCILTAIF